MNAQRTREYELQKKKERMAKPDSPERTRLILKDLNNLRAKHAKWEKEHPELSKFSIVCIHIIFPVNNEKVTAIRTQFTNLTEAQAGICNGLMYLCDGCALIINNAKLNPAQTGNYQLVKFKDFYKNIKKILER